MGYRGACLLVDTQILVSSLPEVNSNHRIVKELLPYAFLLIDVLYLTFCCEKF